MNEKSLVLATCSHKKSVILYDLATYDGENLDNSEVWSFEMPYDYFPGGGIAAVKYRENTVFGDVVIVCAGNNGYAAIISYPDKKILWEVFDCGANAHAIEILPSGNIVAASSHGCVLRLFASSAVLIGDIGKATSYREYTLANGHGVLWDPKYQVLWALGGDTLKAYSVAGEGAEEELVLREDLGCELRGMDGHDLSADFQNTEFLWVTSHGHVFHFRKATGELLTEYEHNHVLDHPNVKGFGNHPEGKYYFSVPDFGKGTWWEGKGFCSWSTDRIHFCQPNREGNALKMLECISGENAFYKIFSFYGKYQ